MSAALDTRRQVAMLAIVIRAPREGVTVSEILTALPVAMRVHARSVQRDLVALSRWAPIDVDASAKPYQWFRTRRAPCPCCQRGMR